MAEQCLSLYLLALELRDLWNIIILLGNGREHFFLFLGFISTHKVVDWPFILNVVKGGVFDVLLVGDQADLAEAVVGTIAGARMGTFDLGGLAFNDRIGQFLGVVVDSTFAESLHVRLGLVVGRLGPDVDVFLVCRFHLL